MVLVVVIVVVLAVVSRPASILLVVCLTADAGRVAMVVVGVVVMLFAADGFVMRLLRSAWNMMRPPLLRQRSSRLNTRRMALRIVTLVPRSPARPVAAVVAVDVAIVVPGAAAAAVCKHLDKAKERRENGQKEREGGK